MCKCIETLVKKGCVAKDEDRYFIHGTIERKVLAGCEMIYYCPVCGEKLKS
jgi:hypothetical protein